MLFKPFGFYSQIAEEAPIGPVSYYRYDPYSGSLRLAIPGTQFSYLGMSNYYDDVHADIKGSGTNITANPTGSASEFFASSETNFSSEDYTTSVYTKDAGSWGAAAASELPFFGSDFVIEGWVYLDETFNKPPYWKVALRASTGSYDIEAALGFSAGGSTANVRSRIMINATQYVSSDFALSQNQWHHIAWVRSGGSLYTYYNGTKISNGTTGLTVNSNGPIRIFTGENSTNDGTAGAWQDFRVYIGTDKNYTATTINPAASIVTLQEQDSDAGAFIGAAGITDGTQQDAVNQLVLDLKDAGLWTKLKAIYPFVGGTASTHKWNLKDPQDTNAAYRLTFSGGITHSSNGIKGNGSTGYYNTYMAHNTLGQNNASMFVYIRDNIAEDRVDMGMLDTASPYTGFQINARSTANTITARMNDSTLSSVANTDARGLIGVSRLSSTSYSISKDTTQTSKSVTSTGTKTRQIFGLCFNLNGNPGFYTTRQQAFASLGDGLTDAEIDDLYTAVQAFQTTLGRNV